MVLGFWAKAREIGSLGTPPDSHWYPLGCSDFDRLPGEIGREIKGDGEAAAERLDQSPRCVRSPEGLEMRHLPALSTGPLERGRQRLGAVGR